MEEEWEVEEEEGEDGWWEGAEVRCRNDADRFHAMCVVRTKLFRCVRPILYSAQPAPWHGRVAFA